MYVSQYSELLIAELPEFLIFSREKIYFIIDFRFFLLKNGYVLIGYYGTFQMQSSEFTKSLNFGRRGEGVQWEKMTKFILEHSIASKYKKKTMPHENLVLYLHNQIIKSLNLYSVFKQNSCLFIVPRHKK